MSTCGRLGRLLGRTAASVALSWNNGTRPFPGSATYKRLPESIHSPAGQTNSPAECPGRPNTERSCPSSRKMRTIELWNELT